MENMQTYELDSIDLCMRQNGRLNPELYDPVIKSLIQLSDSIVQAGFPVENR